VDPIEEAFILGFVDGYTDMDDTSTGYLNLINFDEICDS